MPIVCKLHLSRKMATIMLWEKTIARNKPIPSSVSAAATSGHPTKGRCPCAAPNVVRPIGKHHRNDHQSHAKHDVPVSVLLWWQALQDVPQDAQHTEGEHDIDAYHPLQHGQRGHDALKARVVVCHGLPSPLPVTVLAHPTPAATTATAPLVTGWGIRPLRSPHTAWDTASPDIPRLSLPHSAPSRAVHTAHKV